MPHVEIERSRYDTDPVRVIRMDAAAWGWERVNGFMADLRALPCTHAYDRFRDDAGHTIWKIWIADADAALALRLRWC